MSSAKSRVSKKDILNRNLPKNPKYENVRPRVDSGASIRRYVERMQEVHRDVKYKRDEIFKRIKVTTFVTLIVEVYKETFESQCQEETIPNLPPLRASITPSVLSAKSFRSDHKSMNGVRENKRFFSAVNNTKVSNDLFKDPPPVRTESALSSASTIRSTFQSVISGIGEMDLKDSRPASVSLPKNISSHPYLLLDVRDPDAYRQCHIITAKNYPRAMLIRTCNYETNDMLAYKNTPNKIIIVYDEDETLASSVASTLVQRGYDNIFMLSGGLKLAAHRFPSGLITGILPLPCRQDSLVATRRTSSLTRLNTQNLSESVDFPILRDCFTIDDLRILQYHLDKCLSTLAPSSRCGSECSTRIHKRTQSPYANHSAKVRPWK